MKPHHVSLSDGEVMIVYDFDESSQPMALASQTVFVVFEGRQLGRVHVLEGDRRGLAHRLLGRLVPDELTDYVDSLPDQFVATAATDCLDPARFDIELGLRLREAIDEVMARASCASPEAQAYLRTVWILLNNLNNVLPKGVRAGKRSLYAGDWFWEIG
jgi:hypothetical protein